MSETGVIQTQAQTQTPLSKWKKKNNKSSNKEIILRENPAEGEGYLFASKFGNDYIIRDVTLNADGDEDLVESITMHSGELANLFYMLYYR